MDMRTWVRHTNHHSWGSGVKSGYGNWIRNVESVHGNSLLSPRTAYLYALETQGGDLLKWGVSQDPFTRYPQGFMLDKTVRIFGQGSRAEMTAFERYLVETDPGPLNVEPWAGAAR